jgi:hypothetical protein
MYVSVCLLQVRQFSRRDMAADAMPRISLLPGWRFFVADSAQMKRATSLEGATAGWWCSFAHISGKQVW